MLTWPFIKACINLSVHFVWQVIFPSPRNFFPIPLITVLFIHNLDMETCKLSSVLAEHIHVDKKTNLDKEMANRLNFTSW